MQLKIIQLTEKLWQDCLFKDIYGYFLNGTIINCILQMSSLHCRLSCFMSLGFVCLFREIPLNVLQLLLCGLILGWRCRGPRFKLSNLYKEICYFASSTRSQLFFFFFVLFYVCSFEG